MEEKNFLFSGQADELAKALKSFFVEKLVENYAEQAELCSIKETYPDETDLRFAASEMQNPVGCY